MGNPKTRARRRYREAFKKGEDVWYLSRYTDAEPQVWTKVDKNHIWKESKYWYAFTNERWSVNCNSKEYLKTHILLPSGRWAER